MKIQNGMLLVGSDYEEDNARYGFEYHTWCHIVGSESYQTAFIHLHIRIVYRFDDSRRLLSAKKNPFAVCEAATREIVCACIRMTLRPNHPDSENSCLFVARMSAESTSRIKVRRSMRWYGLCTIQCDCRSEASCHNCQLPHTPSKPNTNQNADER